MLRLGRASYPNVMTLHCVKSVQIRSFSGPYFPISVFSPNTGKYGPEKTPYLDTFHAVLCSMSSHSCITSIKNVTVIDVKLFEWNDMRVTLPC